MSELPGRTDWIGEYNSRGHSGGNYERESRDTVGKSSLEIRMQRRGQPDGYYKVPISPNNQIKLQVNQSQTNVNVMVC